MATMNFYTLKIFEKMKSVALFKSSGCAKYSDCGKLLAISRKKVLTIVFAEKLTIILELFSPNDIEDFQWSPDSQFILCTSQNAGTVEVFSLLRPAWVCRINCGLEGIEQACWNRYPREIITVSKCNVRIRVWSLQQSQSQFPSTVKYFKNAALSLSGCGRYFAASGVEQNSIQIFNTETWKKEREISQLRDFSVPIWSPVEDYFALQPTASYKECHVQIFSAATGKRVGEFQRECGKNLRGSKLIKFSFCGQLLAIGCYDGAIFVLDHILWSPLCKFKSTTIIDKRNDCTVLRMNFSHYEKVEKRPVSLSKLDNRCLGVKFLEFSTSGKLASVDESMPAVVWVWDLKKLCLELIVVCKGRIKSLAWGDNGSLSVCDSYTEITVVDKGLENAEIVGDGNHVNIFWQPGGHVNPQFLVMKNSEVCVFCKI